MLGLLVHGGNHFIVQGPRPGHGTALALAQHWSVIQIGGETPAELQAWRIVSKAFRENLEWAVVIHVARESFSTAVNVLLAELVARGIEIMRINGKPCGENDS